MREYYIPTHAETAFLHKSILHASLLLGRPSVIRTVHPNLMAALWLRPYVQLDGDVYIPSGPGYYFWRKNLLHSTRVRS